MLVFTPESGQLIQGENRRHIKVGKRHGLLVENTYTVLKYLLNSTLLYVNNAKIL
jgi:biliverdin reductase